MTTRSPLLAILLLAACGSGGGGTTPDAAHPPDAAGNAQLVSLAVAPRDATFVVLNNGALQRQYRAVGTYDDGSTRDLTDQASWTTFDPALLGIDQSGLAVTSSSLGGQTIVKASIGSIDDQTGATVIQRWQVVAAGVPADIATQFDGANLDATPGRAPAVMYPSDGTVLPPNFPGLDVQFLKGTTNNIYELAMDAGFLQYREYAPCNAAGIPGGVGCAITPDLVAWDAIGTMFTGKDVAVTVTGLATTTVPMTKAASSPRTLRFIAEDLTAGLYYWAASVGSLYRFDFGHAGVPAELFYSAGGGGSCVGCHALSRDGTLAAVGINSPSPSGLTVLDVATKAVLWSGAYGTVSGSNYHAFSPDDTMLLTTDGYTLEVRDALTGAVLPFGNVAQSSLFPDWSPDGGTILYTKVPSGCTASPCSTFTTAGGSIAIRPFDGFAFGAEELLVQYTGINNYYPAFTPDNAWVVFNRVNTADSMGQQDSYNNPYCKLWAVSAVPGGNPIQMSAANGGYTGNTWPKVAPTMKAYSGGSVTFITFTSTRPIGLKTGGVSQIWMAAYDPARAAMGLDPSFPAVHLPWQDTTSANHIAEWATDIPHDPCGPMGECPSGEFCEGGECVPVIP